MNAPKHCTHNNNNNEAALHAWQILEGVIRATCDSSELLAARLRHPDDNEPCCHDLAVHCPSRASTARVSDCSVGTILQHLSTLHAAAQQRAHSAVCRHNLLLVQISILMLPEDEQKQMPIVVAQGQDDNNEAAVRFVQDLELTVRYHALILVAVAIPLFLAFLFDSTWMHVAVLLIVAVDLVACTRRSNYSPFAYLLRRAMKLPTNLVWSPRPCLTCVHWMIASGSCLLVLAICLQASWRLSLLACHLLQSGSQVALIFLLSFVDRSSRDCIIITFH